MSTPEDKDHHHAHHEEAKPEEPKSEPYIPVEDVSFSFLFFLLSGALLVTTLWTFWDDEFSRRGFKKYQELFFKTEYYTAREQWKKINDQIAAKEKELQASLQQVSGQVEGAAGYDKLVNDTRLAQIRLEESKIQKKFAISRLDEAYYYFKKAQHAGENYQVLREKHDEIVKEIDGFGPVIAENEVKYKQLEDQLLAMKAKKIALEEELRQLTNDRTGLERKMDFYQPFPFFWKPAEIQQAVIPGSRLNKFKEISYKVDRCMTCHIAYDSPGYEKFAEPVRTHANLDIYIKKHPPGVTGCTWCHKGQGSATAPVEDAHGSHHEMDQTAGINEPLLHGDFMQSQCRNCHDDVINLDGAPQLSKGKRLFLKLGCHGCHLAEGFEKADKVGPRLLRVGYKVNATWLYNWLKNPKAYLPKTRMPDFSLSDRDALAVSAYLIASSEEGYKLPDKFQGGDPKNGQRLFESVGCLACHELNGKGEVFGPDLTHVASKVNPDWLVTWLSNPKVYNEKSLMPNLRLSHQDASDLTAFILQHDTPKLDPEIEEKVKAPELAAYGETVIRNRGCFACHDIKGMESEGRIAPELSAFGAKQTWELEFGDSHVPHSWEGWASTKLKKPDSFRTERVLDKMPNFHLEQDEIDALVVLLRGFNGENIPETYRRILSEREKSIETGRRLISKYNCRGCHVVEGEGGNIQQYLNGKQFYPPPLDKDPYHVGERIRSSWLFSFLKNPTPVRTWIPVRMPTFFFSDKEVRDLTAYFEALVPGEMSRYEQGVHLRKDPAAVRMGAEIVSYMDCGNCHDDGVKGIDFSIANQRLRQDWIPKWLKDTRELIPDTKMPQHWEKREGKYFISSRFSKLNEMEGGDIDKQVSDIRDYIASYNTPESGLTSVAASKPKAQDDAAPSASAPAAGKKKGDDDDEDEEEEDD